MRMYIIVRSMHAGIRQGITGRQEHPVPRNMRKKYSSAHIRSPVPKHAAYQSLCIAHESCEHIMAALPKNAVANMASILSPSPTLLAAMCGMVHES